MVFVGTASYGGYPQAQVAGPLGINSDITKRTALFDKEQSTFGKK